VLVDPLSLLAAGFWLSFAGVAWLTWCLPRETGPAWAGLVRAQAVASVGLLPLTVILFGQASAAGPLANLVAVPLWSLLVAPLAVGGVAVDVLWPAAAAWLWGAAAFVLDPAWPLFEAVARSALALHWLPEPHALAFPLAIIGAAWMLLPRGLPGRWLGLALWLPLLWPDTCRPAEGEVEVTAIDVGQGLAVLVRTRDHALLYDTGPAVPDGFDAGERAVVPALHARGVGGRLDRLVLSHADNDHAGGLQAVLAEVPVVSLQAPEGAGIPGAAACVGGDAWTWDGVRFEWLHPPPYFPYLANESSCVLRIEAAGRAVLLTGDIGEIIERRLLAEARPKLRADVVFAGHHGSRHSSDPAFVGATGARHVAFSTGHGNRFRHPARVVVERWDSAGAIPWDTARHGALTFRLRADGVDVESHRQRTARLWDATRIPAADGGLSYRRD
jgi:competence protein ComEC